MSPARRRALTLLACLLAWNGASHAESAPAAPPRGTMRVDYIHTGGQGLEIFALDRVVVEPLPWPGHPSRALDDTGLGEYRFEIVDANGRTTYSRGFASIYGEWVTTAEAADAHRSFHESVRFPMPDGPVTLRIQRRDSANVFREAWQTRIDPADMFVQRTAPPPQRLIEIERNGNSPDKFDLLLLGDGYTADECAAKFGRDAERLLRALFAREPFTSRRSDFNVWGLCPPARESGISRPSTGVQRASPVGATYDAFGSERYVLTFENRALRDVAANAPYEALAILVNGVTYGGGGIFNTFATVAVDNDWAEYVFVHELGHHFAALADEYYTSPVAYQPVTRVIEPWQTNVTALLEPERLKWRDLVAKDTPLPTPWAKDEYEARQREFQAERQRLRSDRRPEAEMSALFRREQEYSTALLGREAHAGQVGAFRGANYDAQAYYRPQTDCVMFTRNVVAFCQVCQRGLTRIIDLYAGAN